MDAFGLDYNVDKQPGPANRSLTKSEQKIYNGLKRMLKQIKLHQEGKIVLPTIEKVISEMEASL